MGWANDSIRSMLASFEISASTAVRGMQLPDGEILMFHEATDDLLIEIYAELKDEKWRNKYNIKEFLISDVIEGIEKEFRDRRIKISSLRKYKCDCGHPWHKENSIKKCHYCDKPYCIFCGYKHDCQTEGSDDE